MLILRVVLQPEKDGVRNVCYDVCYRPGATRTLPAQPSRTAPQRTASTLQSSRAPLSSACDVYWVLADGTQLVAGVGNRVLVFDAVDGDLLHALKGHKVLTLQHRRRRASL